MYLRVMRGLVAGCDLLTMATVTGVTPGSVMLDYGEYKNVRFANGRNRQRELEIVTDPAEIEAHHVGIRWRRVLRLTRDAIDTAHRQHRPRSARELSAALDAIEGGIASAINRAIGEVSRESR